MKISEIIGYLETLAPPQLQESYDNSGLLTGNSDWECNGIVITLDATEPVVQEAINKNCNLVIAHHPILFRGIKRITGGDYVQKTLIASIKNDIAVYAIHTNLDNVINGVSGKMAEILGLVNIEVLSPKEDSLEKLYTFVPVGDAFAGLVIPVVESAADALTLGELSRVRRCADPRCQRVFFDNTKNGRRRWCDMSTCGNRAKAARHREKLKSH